MLCMCYWDIKMKELEKKFKLLFSWELQDHTLHSYTRTQCPQYIILFTTEKTYLRK